MFYAYTFFILLATIRFLYEKKGKILLITQFSNEEICFGLPEKWMEFISSNKETVEE